MSGVAGLYERPTMRLTWAAATHVGKVRPHNEDGFIAAAGLWVVADGMGGHEAGEVAAALALEVCEEFLDHIPLPLDEVSEIVRRANARVHDHANTVGPVGMGTTLVGAAVVDNAGHDALAVFNVGDSRVYRFTPEQGVEQLTHDHSVVQELIDAGELDEADAGRHPERNVVTRVVGVDAHVTGDYRVVPQADFSRLLICSDGVSGQLPPAALSAILGAEGTPDEIVTALLNQVLAGPAVDNLTAIVVDVARFASDDDDDDTADITGPRPLRRPILIDDVPIDPASDPEPDPEPVTPIPEVPV